MHDAHFHMSDPLLKYSLKGIANASSPEEYNRLREYDYIVSAGIHPWYVDCTEYDAMLPCLEKADMIGEIGLDNTWCSTDLTLQKNIFEKQLKLACKLHKPVILHLKGMEKEAYSYICKYPNTYIVHWHSSKEMIQEYIDLGCYFTIGPSIEIDEAVNEVCRKCPLDKLLLESDGIEAIAWAYGCKEEDVSYLDALTKSIGAISKIKNMPFAEMEIQLDKNFYEIEKKTR